jgi:sulfite reductase (ferredoxin)
VTTNEIGHEDASARVAQIAAEGARARAPRPSSKPNGQWKIDGKAPLNGNE